MRSFQNSIFRQKLRHKTRPHWRSLRGLVLTPTEGFSSQWLCVFVPPIYVRRPLINVRIPNWVLELLSQIETELAWSLKALGLGLPALHGSFYGFEGSCLGPALSSVASQCASVLSLQLKGDDPTDLSLRWMILRKSLFG